MKNTQTMLQKAKIPPLSQDDLMENILPKHLKEMFAEVAANRKIREEQAKKD
jgi:hypothetical protein